MGLFSAADVRRSTRRTAVLVELGLDAPLAHASSAPAQPKEPAFALIPRPRAAADDFLDPEAPAPDLRIALVPSPAPVVTPEVLPPTAHPGLARRLACESGTLLVAGVLAIEWAAGVFH
ncbi:MAG TPA: hypothetical protein VHE83_00015 [Mycobacteriales bacterium]|nr:hypothetical protein [Mycobacteriales bacterium]